MYPGSILLSGAALVCTIFSNCVLAQAPVGTGAGGAQPAQLEEIIVTAQKRQENAQDVPIAINALSADTLAQFGISSTGALQEAVAGLNYYTADGLAEIHLRGVGLNSVAPGNENSVATYVDGVYISSTSASLFMLNNVTGVEVDKGPQGTLFGRNATGGVVSVTTRDPSQDFHATAGLGYASYDTISTNDYVTGGISDTLATDMAVYYANRLKGYGHNLVTGEEIAKEEDLAVRSKWRWKPTDDDQLTVIFDYEKINSGEALASHPINGLPTQFGGTNPDSLLGGPYTWRGGDYDIAMPFDPTFREQQGGVSARYEHDFAFGQILSTTAYRRESNEVNWSSVPAPTPLEFGKYGRPDHQFTQELQLSSKSGSIVKWILGAYYFNAHAYWAPFNISGPFFDDLVFGTPARPVPGFIHLDTRETTESEAAYGQTTLPVYRVPDTDLTLGLRYTMETRDAFGQELLELGTPPAGTPFFTLGDFGAPGTPNHARFDKLTYRVAIDHHFSKDILGYVSYNTGFKSGGFNITQPGAKPFQPENLDAIELGFKTDWFDRRLRVNASGFYYDYKNIQVTEITLSSAIVVNGAAAHIYGLDLDVQALVTDRISLAVGLESMHDKFLSFPNAPFLIPDYATGGMTQVTADGAGKQLPYVPEFTLTASGTYKLPTSVGPLDFTVSYYHNSGYFAGVENIVRQNAYNVVNFLATWTSPNDRYQIGGFIDNLTNSRYSQTLTELGNPGGWAQEIYAPPRTFGVNAQVKF